MWMHYERPRLACLPCGPCIVSTGLRLAKLYGKESIMAVRDERSVAIQSTSLWRDQAAVPALQKAITSKDLHIRRLAAMALGRIGDRSSMSALLKAGLGELDPFLKHAITYALFEMGVAEEVPENHALAKQLRIMAEVARSGPNPNVRPYIKQADPVDTDPIKVAHQYTRMGELRKHFNQTKGDPVRGEKLFADASKSLCITCHRMGDQGTAFWSGYDEHWCHAG